VKSVISDLLYSFSLMYLKLSIHQNTYQSEEAHANDWEQ